MIALLKTGLATATLLVAGLTVAFSLYFGGYISRAIVSAESPDGRHAVCRGWYPDQMDYELWIRNAGEWFGRRIGKVGAESSGRCGGVAWSDDGQRIAVSSISGHLSVFDATTGKAIGHQQMLAVGSPGTRPTPRLVTAIAFESADTLRLTMCPRQWPAAAETPYYACGGEMTAASVPLALAPARRNRQ